MTTRISAIQLQHKKHDSHRQLIQYFADRNGWLIDHTGTMIGYKFYKYKNRNVMLRKVNELVGAATLSDYVITEKTIK